MRREVYREVSNIVAEARKFSGLRSTRWSNLRRMVTRIRHASPPRRRFWIAGLAGQLRVWIYT